jgi:hypothetical protein
MKKKLLLAVCPLALLALTGCASVNKQMTALVRELKNDPATAYVRIVTSAGVFEFVRTNPGSNTVPHSIDPNGTVKVGFGGASSASPTLNP